MKNYLGCAVIALNLTKGGTVGALSETNDMSSVTRAEGTVGNALNVLAEKEHSVVLLLEAARAHCLL